jgi:hypothetical protein
VLDPTYKQPQGAFMKTLSSRVLTTAILLAFLLAAALPVSAFADEGTPPPPTEEPASPDEGEPPVTEDAGPSEEIAPPDEPVVEEPVIEDVAVEEPVAEEVVVEEPVIEEPAIQETLVEDLAALLADLPADTELVVLDEAGEPLPLASEDAAEILAAGDPRWCPVGITPPAVLSESGGCSASETSLQAVLDWLIANPKTVAGVIWIHKDYERWNNDALSGFFEINGDDYGTTANYALTLRGGWNGIGTGITPYDYSEFDVPISIYNWHADISLSDILISSSNSTGLLIATSGNVTITRVDSSNNQGDGAYIDNDYDNGKNVVIIDSEFSDNGTYSAWGGNGLTVYSDGIITLTNVVASGNLMSDWYWNDFEWIADYGNGAELYNWDGNGIVVTNSKFASNQGNGLSAYSSKAVTLINVTAEYNAQDWYYDAGLDEWLSHGGEGAHVTSYTSITLTDFTAIGNDSYGAYLDTWWAGILAPITLNSTNVFGENGADGLRIWSWGAVKLNNIIANSNGWTGAVINNCWEDSGMCAETQPITLTGTNEFKFNGDGGIYVYSGGAITINNITASNNSDWEGAWLENYYSPLAAKPAVTLTGNNTFNDNGADGLHIFSKGAIKINNLVANGNGWWNGGAGAWLENCGPYDSGGDIWICEASPQPVVITVSGGETDTELMNNESYGIYIESNGAISLVGVIATGNGYRGGFLDNNWVGAVGGVTIGGWGGRFSDNDDRGLSVYSTGAISVTHLYAWGNAAYGALLSNLGGVAPVTFTGESSFGNNGGDVGGTGLMIHSKGTITLANLYAENNNGSGVILDNTASITGLANITLTGVNTFNNNYDGNGLEVNSYGTISVANINAYDNQGASGGFGAYFDNYQSGLGPIKPIILSGNNTFEQNGWTGLDIASKGAITVNNVKASDNGGFGALLSNQLTGAVGGVNVNNASTYNPEFSRNGLDGLRIESNGAVTIKDLDAMGNGLLENSRDLDFGPTGYGVYIVNTGGTANVMLGTSRLKWCNGLAENFRSGLWITTKGTVTLSNVCDWTNGLDTADEFDTYIPNGYGAYIDNFQGGNLKNVTLNGTNAFDDNASGGLFVFTQGVVTLNNVQTNDNGWRTESLDGGGDGVYIDNCDYYDDTCHNSTPRAVSLKGSNSFNDNWDGGLEIHSIGLIALNSIDAWNNWFGILLDNNEPNALGGVIITGGVWTAENDTFGMDVSTKGAITINVSDAWAGDNGWYGWNLDNQLGLSGVGPAVNLTSSNVDWAFDFANNGYYGLQIQSNGAIKVTGLDAGGNGWNGALLKNNFTGAIGGITITAPTTGENSFNDNWIDGLIVLSNGPISVAKLGAHNNGWQYDEFEDEWLPIMGYGVLLDNSESGLLIPPNVTLTGYGNFGNNADDGLIVFSKGLISLTNIDASSNGQYNMWVQNNYPEEEWGTYLSDSGWGAYIDNALCNAYEDCDGVVGKGITLNGNNTFNGNYQDGLWITSLGAIKAYLLSADSNGSDGAYLDNQWGMLGEVGGVTATGAWQGFTNNGSRGLNIYSHGPILLTNIIATSNGFYGLDVDAMGLTTSPTVIMNGSNVFNNNGGDGLRIWADGNITLYNLTANNNGWSGTYLNSVFGNVSLYRTMPGSNTFNGNDDGLFVEAAGNVTLNKITADNNRYSGVYVVAGGTVLWACGSTTNNGWYDNDGFGWYIDAAGTITLNNVWSLGNWDNYLASHAFTFSRSC